MEAMACDLPIVSTHFKSWIQELIGEWWWYICASLDEYVQAMERICIKTMQREKMKIYNKKFVKKFDKKNVINERIDLL